MKFHWKYLIFLLLIFTVFNTLKAQNLIVRVDPQSITTEINQTVSLNITIENVNNLGGFQLDVFYDTHILRASNATMGEFLGSSGRTPIPLGPEIDNNSNPGKITFGGATFGTGAGANGNGVLAKIEFAALTAGNSTIDLQNVQISDINGQSLNINSVNDGEIVVQGGNANEIIVINTNNDGDGSLRWALEQANSNAGSDRIIFNIPQSDANYDNEHGIWKIVPQSFLPTISDADLTIDGLSQSTFIGEDTNPAGPEIVIDGINVGADGDGLTISASNVTIIGLVINNFSQAGIYISSVLGGRVSACYIGTFFAGVSPAPNNYGIWLYNSKEVLISPQDTLPNVISGNNNTGIYLNGSSHNIILGNIIGLQASGLDTLGNSLHGICIQDYSDSNEVVDNFIGGNGNGIYIARSNANMIANNFIGRGEDLEIQIGNTIEGINITGNSQGNTIMENMIGNNTNNGILIIGNQTIHNPISRNSITSNGELGIDNRYGGNIELSPPQILTITLTFISGTAPPNATVEIFADENNQGAIFLDTVTADASGNFSLTGEGFPADFFFTATATDAEGNTSEFSNAIKASTEVGKTISQNTPDRFSLYQNYPNPFNPETVIEYHLPKSSSVGITIFNLNGQRITTLLNKKQSAGSFELKWDGRNEEGHPVSSGIYIYQIKAGEFSNSRKMMLLR